MPGFLTRMSMPLPWGSPVYGVDWGSTPCGCFHVAVAALGVFSSGPSSTAPSDAVSRVTVIAAVTADVRSCWKVGSSEKV